MCRQSQRQYQLESQTPVFADLDQTKEMQTLGRQHASTTSPIRPSNNTFTRPTSQSCKPDCLCDCHRLYSFRVSGCRATGSAFVTVRGLPVLSKRCSDSFCFGPTSNVGLTVSLHLPTWLLSKAIVVNVLASRWHEPCLHVAVRNILPRNHEWFDAVRLGQLDQMQQMLRQCPSRVNDVNDYGRNALMVSLLSIY